MNKLEVIVRNPDFRNIFTIAKIAEKSINAVRIVKGHANLDAKSIMGIITLGLRKGDIVSLESEDIDTLKLIAGVI